MKLPYGIADFYSLVTSGYVYVDRTADVRTLEDMGRALLFLRPRRFGKSLWLQTLATYYDLRRAGEHQKIFGELAIGRDPTPLAHQYFVMVWDFSNLKPQGTIEEIGRRLDQYVLGTVEAFLSDYRDELPGSVKVREDPIRTLENLLGAIRQTPHPLYLLVDEYDNFADEVMVVSEESYRGLVHADGPLKALFKWVKAAMAGRGLERLFITGVSPLVMSDITSGLNICSNVYLDPRLNTLCGFVESEVEDLTARLLIAMGERAGPEIDAVSALAMMRTWYDGYRFSPDASELVYNPTLVLYFLAALLGLGKYPRQMLDANLAVDEGKLDYLSQVASGQQAVLDLVQSGQPLEVIELEESFTLRAMLDRSSQDRSFLASYLYYVGMLTLAGESPRGRLRLEPPNLVVRKLYVDEIQRFLLPDGSERGAGEASALKLLAEGEIEPLLRFVEDRIFKVFGVRDYLWMDEHALKMAFLVLLFQDVNYVVHSEAELERNYADLCLLRRPDRRAPGLYDVLFEFKYLKLRSVDRTGRELRRLERDELERLPGVEDAFAEAESQLREYRHALERRFGATLRLRAYAVVALGFERLLARDLTASESRPEIR